MRFIVATFLLTVCLLASRVVSAAAPLSLEAAVDRYRDVCLAPYYEGKSHKEIMAAMIARKTAEPFLARLAIGAPQKWKPLVDRKIPLENRLAAAIALLGAAISQGRSEDKRIAKAYSAMYFPVPKSRDCQLPKGLPEFVNKNNFWRLSPPAFANPN